MASILESPIHFIGIGGTGMSGLAELALHRGYTVQGSDLRSSWMTDHLARLGAHVMFGHRPENVNGAKTVIYSSAISQDNPEMLAAQNSGHKLWHRSDFLAFLMQGYHSITVAGTHGKSTTSAMIAHVLTALNLDPVVATGGIMHLTGSTARTGNGQIFVAEADESDGSFLKYRPHLAIVTNIDPDHMDYYRTEERLIGTFREYLGEIREDGMAILGWDNPRSRLLGGNYEGNRLTYGLLIGSEVRAYDIRWDGSHTIFQSIVERDLYPVRLKMIGQHNVQNALCALAVTRALDLDVAAAARSLADFQGVARRLTCVFDDGKTTIFDDYAHNPGKIAACIQGLRKAYPDRPLHVIYQPHRYTRLETMYDETLASLRDAQHVYWLPVYAAGETTQEDFSPERLAKDLQSEYGVPSHACADLHDAANKVLIHSGPRSVILTVGAGDVHKCSTQLRDVKAKAK